MKTDIRDQARADSRAATDRTTQRVRADFRVYGELNDFLPPIRRQCTINTECARHATVKHMIEALGVPHTEVELILVNGQDVAFDRLIHDNDRITAYPTFHQLDISMLQHRRAGRQNAERFVADVHLGGLARLLRMAGFDTLYKPDYSDDEIASIAEAEDRIVLSRDRELLKRRQIARGRYVRGRKSSEQFCDVIERFALTSAMKPLSRCLECNVPLKDCGLDEAKSRVPPRVAALYDRFRCCPCCMRIYWEGSHWRAMRTLLSGFSSFPAHSENPSP